MFEVRVPMTSANVACGFDTLGIAFQEYSIFDFELSTEDMKKISELDKKESLFLNHDDVEIVKWLNGRK